MNGDKFPHPCPNKKVDKFAEPIIFQKFPDAKEDVKEYISCNLVGLTIEKVHDYILNTVILKLQKQWKAEHDDDNNDDDDDDNDDRTNEEMPPLLQRTVYDEDDESIRSNDHSENDEEADINADSNVDSNNDVDQAACDAKMKEFKKYINIRNFDLSTAWKWMKWLGMNYSANGKTYYVDGHE